MVIPRRTPHHLTWLRQSLLRGPRGGYNMLGEGGGLPGNPHSWRHYIDAGQIEKEQTMEWWHLSGPRDFVKTLWWSSKKFVHVGTTARSVFILVWCFAYRTKFHLNPDEPPDPRHTTWAKTCFFTKRRTWQWHMKDVKKMLRVWWCREVGQSFPLTQHVAKLANTTVVARSDVHWLEGITTYWFIYKMLSILGCAWLRSPRLLESGPMPLRSPDLAHAVSLAWRMLAIPTLETHLADETGETVWICWVFHRHRMKFCVQTFGQLVTDVTVSVAWGARLVFFE